jgi:hypothetical membrane protein
MARSAPGRALLWCGVVAGPLFVVAFLAQGAVRAGYDPLVHPVSSLALGPSGWTQSVNFVVTGALLLAFAAGLWLQASGVITPVLIAIVAVGLIGAGFFPADPINGYPPGTPLAPPYPTTDGALHDAFSALFFLGLPITCLVVAWRAGRSRRVGWAVASVLIAVAFLGTFVLAGMGFSQDPAFLPFGGLWQRVSVAIGMGWLTALALDPP